MVKNILYAVCRTDNGYNAYAPDYPGCMAFGKTMEEARENLSGALDLHIRGMVEDGEDLPSDNLDFGFIRIAVPSTNQKMNGELLRDFRKRNGMTQSEFAEKLEVTKETVSEWERGRRELPGVVKFALEAMV